MCPVEGESFGIPFPNLKIRTCRSFDEVHVCLCVPPSYVVTKTLILFNLCLQVVLSYYVININKCCMCYSSSLKSLKKLVFHVILCVKCPTWSLPSNAKGSSGVVILDKVYRGEGESELVGNVDRTSHRISPSLRYTESSDLQN